LRAPRRAARAVARPPEVVQRPQHAVLIGGVLLGIIGALVASPVAAAIRVLLQEIAIRRLDKS
jgi:hypothetical protein